MFGRVIHAIGASSVAFTATILAACGGDTPRSIPAPPNAKYDIYEGRETVVLSPKLLSCSYNGFFGAIVVNPCVEALNEDTRYPTYGRMGDFEPEWGTSYEVTVDHWRRSEYIADASLYHLVAHDVVELTEDPVGTQYHYENMQVEYTFDQNWRFAGRAQWSCQAVEGCDWIFASADPVDLTFEIGPDREMLLIEARVSSPD